VPIFHVAFSSREMLVKRQILFLLIACITRNGVPSPASGAILWMVVRPKSDTLFSRKVSHLGQCLNTHGVWSSGTEAEGSPIFLPKGGHGVKVRTPAFRLERPF
jgi:hypothetical protein